MRILQMIHDLYVLERPDWQPSGFSDVFAAQFQGIAPHVDQWLTSSVHVKGQVEQYLDNWWLPVQPVSVLPMGWDSFGSERMTAPDGDQSILDRYGVRRRPFILFVGTLEQNLQTLLEAMEALRARLGRKTPALVVAGGYGWRARSVRRQLQQGVRQGRLYWVANLSDEELRAFYREARFTVMPSHGEGWGLAIPGEHRAGGAVHRLVGRSDAGSGP